MNLNKITLIIGKHFKILTNTISRLRLGVSKPCNHLAFILRETIIGTKTTVIESKKIETCTNMKTILFTSKST